MSKVLITGAGGYIGINTTYLFLKAGYSVVALDNFTCGFRQPLEMLQDEFGKDKLTIYQNDLVEDGGHSVFEKESNIDGVLHFAALLNVGESMEMPEKYFTNNIIGTQKLLQQCIDRKIVRFIFSSSCTVYGDIENPPVNESFPLQEPSSVYGMTKKICEDILRWYDKLKRIKYVSLRYFNVCGASDDSRFGDAKKETFGLMQNAIKGALGIHQFEFNYQKVETPDGSPIRDFINVVDLAEAHIKAYEYLVANNTSDVFNLGTGTGNSVLEVVTKIKETLGVDFSVAQSNTRRTGEIPKIFADYSKANKILKWSPARTMKQSIETLAAFYKKNPHGWDH